MSWTASKHPRGAKGSGQGGKFISSQSDSSGSKSAKVGVKKRLGGRISTQDIREFQRRNGLTVDGIIGRQTAAALLGDTQAKIIPIGSMTPKQVAALEMIAGGKLGATVKSGTPKPRAGKKDQPLTKAKTKKKKSTGGAALAPKKKAALVPAKPKLTPKQQQQIKIRQAANAAKLSAFQRRP
jgi:Putative peptidoglycan binding domain